jgi:hypothetical protein
LLGLSPQCEGKQLRVFNRKKPNAQPFFEKFQDWAPLSPAHAPATLALRTELSSARSSFGGFSQVVSRRIMAGLIYSRKPENEFFSDCLGNADCDLPASPVLLI